MSSAESGSQIEIVRCRTARNRAPISVSKLHRATVLIVHHPLSPKCTPESVQSASRARQNPRLPEYLSQLMRLIPKGTSFVKKIAYITSGQTRIHIE
jgi:hypothetical protein